MIERKKAEQAKVRALKALKASIEQQVESLASKHRPGLAQLCDGMETDLIKETLTNEQKKREEANQKLESVRRQLAETQ